MYAIGKHQWPIRWQVVHLRPRYLYKMCIGWPQMASIRGGCLKHFKTTLDFVFSFT